VKRVRLLTDALVRTGEIDRRACRADFEARFTLERMVAGHVEAYSKVVAAGDIPAVDR